MAAKKTLRKQSGTKKTATRKPAAKKPETRKPKSAKASAGGAAATRAASSGKKTAEKKTAAKKPAAKKTAAKKTAAGRTAAKKPAADTGSKSKPEAPAAKDASLSLAVNMGHVFALRPRAHSSFRQEDFREAKLQLQDETYESVGKAARAVAEKALELTHDGPPRRGFRLDRKRR